jgi:enoyl-CoA hydratase/carnithine racemase
LGGRKLTAQEACDRNLVTQVIPAAQFRDKAKEIVSSMAKLPPQVREGMRSGTPGADVMEGRGRGCLMGEGGLNGIGGVGCWRGRVP